MTRYVIAPDVALRLAGDRAVHRVPSTSSSLRRFFARRCSRFSTKLCSVAR